MYGRKFFFQAAIVIFLVGSALSGLSHSMLELIVFRAVQGLGGGGLMVGAQTIVGDVVSPRERGRYMGLFMAMFGVTTGDRARSSAASSSTTSAGGGSSTSTSPSGRSPWWSPTVALPGALSRVHRVIDYLGTALDRPVGHLAWCCSPAWAAPPTRGPRRSSSAWPSAGVVFAVLFLLAERRAVEPVIPLPLFANTVFAAASAIGFVVGFAMFGALTFLPLFFQDVKGISPIQSGVRLFPLMGGLLVASIGSGQLVSRWGRYKVFPVVGTGADDHRALPHVADRGDHRGVDHGRATWWCSASASGWSCRC